MQKDEFIEILKNELAHEHENEIEKVLVFYKNGEILKISTGDQEIQVDKMDLPEDDNDCDGYENPDQEDGQEETEAGPSKDTVPGYGTHMIQLPSGRRINVIN